MGRRLTFTSQAWEEYLYWQGHDKKILKKLNQLLKDCQRDPLTSIGKPEPLKGNLSGAWYRRINDEHRLVYIANDEEIRVASCRYHY